jgi:hypothetical protein
VDIIFPVHPGYQGMFVIGFRKQPGTATTQRVGTVVLKRTYTIDAASGTLAPSDDALPIFTEDQPFDPVAPDTLRYESDLAPFKPETDVVVLGFVHPTTNIDLSVDVVVWLRFQSPLVPSAHAMFGWEPRSSKLRGVGTDGDPLDYSTIKEDYPPVWPVPPDAPNRDPLPPDFPNLHYNGFRRDTALALSRPFNFLSASAAIRIVRPGPNNDYHFNLRGDAPTAVLHAYSGTGADDKYHWQQQTIDMHADTLVIEPDIDRCYLVWRGVWDFDAIAEADLRQLVVEAAA